jgi:hypothetical protein
MEQFFRKTQHQESIVKSGRKIYITVAAFSGEIVEMPNCKDKSLKECSSIIS